MAVPQNALSGSNNLGQIGEILRFRPGFSTKTDVTAGTAIAVPYGCAVSTEIRVLGQPETSVQSNRCLFCPLAGCRLRRQLCTDAGHQTGRSLYSVTIEDLYAISIPQDFANVNEISA